MLRILIGPFGYLRIKHDFKFKVDWLVPLILSIITSLFLYFLIKKDANVFAQAGLVDRVLGFTQILPGFYIAALAAIATFQKNDIDQAMPSPAPVITVRIKGQDVIATLSRRRFLCSLFAFLTAESIFIIFICIFGLTFSGIFHDFFNEKYHAVIVMSYLFGLFFFLWQMVVSTFWGLYYLGDRLHRS